jgi:hypothetical protein
MTDLVGPWPIRLKRNSTRLLAVVGLRALIGAAAVLTAQASPGILGSALRVAGGIVVIYSVLLWLYLATIRLEASAGHLVLYSLLGTRRYQLAKGIVTRLRLPRSWRSPLEAGISGVGVRMGEGELKGEKLLGVVALDRSATLLMVPAVGGRVAVAAESEDELLNALAAATT